MKTPLQHTYLILLLFIYSCSDGNYENNINTKPALKCNSNSSFVDVKFIKEDKDLLRLLDKVTIDSTVNLNSFDEIPKYAQCFIKYISQDSVFDIVNISDQHNMQYAGHMRSLRYLSSGDNTILFTYDVDGIARYNTILILDISNNKINKFWSGFYEPEYKQSKKEILLYIRNNLHNDIVNDKLNL